MQKVTYFTLLLEIVLKKLIKMLGDLINPIYNNRLEKAALFWRFFVIVAVFAIVAYYANRPVDTQINYV